MIHTLTAQIDGSAGLPIAIDACLPSMQQSYPLVIFSHGFKGFKDWGHFNFLAHRFAREGIGFVKFNFSHNGTTPDHPSDFVALQAFGKNTLSIELNDLGLVIDWATRAAPFAAKIDSSKIGLIGHSRGGGISILKAAEDARITRLVTWAAVGNFETWLQKFGLEKWKTEGQILIPNARTKQEMPINYSLREDFEQHQQRLNIPEMAAKLSQPWLICHGTQDEAVPFQTAIELNNTAPNSELFLVEEAGHTFGVGHPFDGDQLPHGAAEVVARTATFLR